MTPSTTSSPCTLFLPALPMLALLLLAGCSTIYNPNSAMAPMFSNAGEVHAIAYAGTSGYEGQVAYSPLNHFGIAASAAFGSDTDDRIDSLTWNHWYLEGALVGYLEVSKIVRLEGVGGIGSGHSNEYIRISATPSGGSRWLPAEGDFLRYFLQVGVCVSYQEREVGSFEFGLVPRIAYVDFSEFQVGNGRVSTPSAFFFEPHYFVRLGMAPVFVELQYGESKPLADEPDFGRLYSFFSFGVHLVFGRK